MREAVDLNTFSLRLLPFSMLSPSFFLHLCSFLSLAFLILILNVLHANQMPIPTHDLTLSCSLPSTNLFFLFHNLSISNFDFNRRNTRRDKFKDLNGGFPEADALLIALAFM